MSNLTLVQALAEVPDHRRAQGRRYSIESLLAFLVCAMLAGRRGLRPAIEWGRDAGEEILKALGLRRVPSLATLSRFVAALNVVAFEAALSRWIAGFLPPSSGLVQWALDGKTLRGSRDGELPGAHLISLFDPVLGFVIAQQAVDSKTNEHKAALAVIRSLAIEGKLLSMDAAFAQRDLCKEIKEAGGHYLVTVKDNQPQLKADCEAAFEPPVSPSGRDSQARDRYARDERRKGPRATRSAHRRGDNSPR
jgi:predicted transposase YbfD/YdcC